MAELAPWDTDLDTEEAPWDVPVDRHQAKLRAGPPKTKWIQKTTGKTGLGQWREVPMTRQDYLDWYQLDEDAAGGDFPSRLAGSMGSSQDVRVNLAKQFDVPVEDMDVWQSEAGTMFMNPETQTRELLDPAGLDVGDIKMAGPEAVVLGAEGIGMVAGGAVSKSPVGVGVGGTIGATAGRAAVLGAAQLTDVVAEPDYIGELALEAGISGGGAAIPYVGRMLGHAVSPGRRAVERVTKATPEEGARPGGPSRLAEDIEAGEEALGPVSEATGAEFSTGQLVSEANPEFGARVIATEEAGQDIIGIDRRAASQRMATGRMAEDLGPVQPVSPEVAGQRIISRAQGIITRKTKRIDKAVENTIDKYGDDLAEMAGTGPTEAGASIRARMQSGSDEVFNELNTAYDEVIGELPEGFSVDIEPIREVAQDWKEILDEDIFQTLTPEDRKLVDQVLDFKPGATKPIRSIQRAIHIVKSQKRKLKGSRDEAILEQIPLIDDMIEGLNFARDEQIRAFNPDLADRLLDLDDAFQKASRTIDESMVGELLWRKRGEYYKTTDDKVLRRVIQSESELTHYLDLGETYPGLNARSDLKEAMRGLYTDQVVEGNIKHKTWFKRNKNNLEQIYTPAELKMFQSAGRTKLALDNLAKRERILVSQMKQSFAYKFNNFIPEQAVKAVDGIPSQARKMKAMLKNHPDDWGAYQDVRRENIVNKIMKDDDASFATVNDMLKGDARRELEITLGADYVKSLDTLRDLTRAKRRQAGQRLQRGNISDVNTTLGTARRMIFGQLDPTSFRARTIGRLSLYQVDVAMERLLNDPALLKKAIAARNLSLKSRTRRTILSQLGVTAAMIDTEEQFIEEEQ